MYMSTNIQQVLAVQEVKILHLVMYIQYTTTNQLDSKGLRIEAGQEVKKFTCCQCHRLLQKMSAKRPLDNVSDTEEIFFPIKL